MQMVLFSMAHLLFDNYYITVTKYRSHFTEYAIKRTDIAKIIPNN